jgi:hypothetical protein
MQLLIKIVEQLINVCINILLDIEIWPFMINYTKRTLTL